MVPHQHHIPQVGMVVNNARYQIQRWETIYSLHNAIIEAEREYLAFFLGTEFLKPVSTFCYRIFYACGGSRTDFPFKPASHLSSRKPNEPSNKSPTKFFQASLSQMSHRAVSH
ncbi:hypothetical protein VNO77_23337 [Canavalia gladiata]|uniref:Uncharacterized protein n=1 Tax=Canavalia gladiata TaxID=3824 RepID=A0AAN9L4C1_CANGL